MQFFGERIREFLGKNEGPPSIVAPLRQSRVFKNAAPREKARENQCFGGPKNCISRAEKLFQIRTLPRAGLACCGFLGDNWLEVIELRGPRWFGMVIGK